MSGCLDWTRLLSFRLMCFYLCYSENIYINHFYNQKKTHSLFFWLVLFLFPKLPSEEFYLISINHSYKPRKDRLPILKHLSLRLLEANCESVKYKANFICITLLMLNKVKGIGSVSFWSIKHEFLLSKNINSGNSCSHQSVRSSYEILTR